MEFRDALHELTSKYGLSILKEHYFSFCVLSDLIKSSIYAKKLNTICFKANSRLNLYDLFTTKSLKEGRDVAFLDYTKFDYNCSNDEFTEAINYICELLNPNEYKLNNYNKKKTVSLLPTFSQAWTPDFDGIDINASCKSLTILTTDNQTCDLYKKDNATGSFIKEPYFFNKKNNLDVSIKDNLCEYYLRVPKQKYKVININQQVGDLYICGNSDKEPFDSTNINIKSSNGKLWMFSNSRNCKIQGSNGDVFLYGNYKLLDIKRTNSNIGGTTAFEKANLYTLICNLYNGNVNLRIPKLNKELNLHNQTNIINYNNTHYIKQKDIKLKLNINNGYLILHNY